VDLPIGLWRLISIPHYLALLPAINGDDLAVDVTAEIVACD
jgi:hypothetical protein